MEEIVLNMCLHPFAQGTEVEDTIARSGLPAAAMLAVNLQRAYRRGVLPALKTCRIISSDFELTEAEIPSQTDWYDDFNPDDPFWSLSVGGICEIVVHDIMRDRTIVMPFRRTKPWPDRDSARYREQRVFEWHDENDVAYLVSLDDIEERLDIDLTPKNIARAQNVVFPTYHTEIFDGLLDRIMIRQKRIDGGTADGRYCSW